MNTHDPHHDGIFGDPCEMQPDGTCKVVTRRVKFAGVFGAAEPARHDDEYTRLARSMVSATVPHL